MEQDTIPTRKVAGNYARSNLLTPFNEIDIYIEDTKKGFSKLYINLFERYFSGTYKITDVHPLGPRKTVIKTCRSKSKLKITRPKLFVVDGDLFLLKGEDVPLPKGVYRLPRYSIENILIDESAIIDYINEEHQTKLKEQIITELSFGNWVSTNKPLLVDLFIHYAISQKLKVKGVKTISYKVNDLTSTDDSIVNEDLVKDRIAIFKEKIIEQNSSTIYNELLAKYKSKISSNDCPLLAHIAGKDYLLPLLKNKIKKVTSKDVPNINFNQRLALKCSTELLTGCEKNILPPN
ncbi:hypothetical protein BCT41_03705 [Vibrio splendidus]|uniref:DUF4435 domain-containing protein n=1 Tax=Vibrio splendidus TaxID=29497 RepID=UPI000C839A92|nr:DUF4435 domain-containing protein [Vibrio splendidus]PMN24944.1 hypothetical protein BCT41_03705 [Vibrio splendidus]